MTEHEAGQLMGVLPLPDLVRRAPHGGIDLSENAHPAVWDLVNGAANVWGPQQIAGMGGWEATVATIGIHDQASDYKAERDAHPDDPSNCSQWPDSVVERYSHEGLLLDD